MKTKKCRSFSSLLKEIEKNMPACIEYHDFNSNPITNQTIVYLKNGTNLILSTKKFEEVRDKFIRVDS